MVLKSSSVPFNIKCRLKQIFQPALNDRGMYATVLTMYDA